MKALTLEKIPKDVFDIIIRKQADIKIKKGCRQFGVENTIYHIVREWHRCIAEREGKE